MAKHLSVVPPAEAKPEGSLPSDVYDLGRGPESTADRVKRLQSEAKLLAHEEVEKLERAMDALVEQARAISEGGDAYVAGVRDIAGRIASDVDQKALMLKAILEKTSHY